MIISDESCIPTLNVVPSVTRVQFDNQGDLMFRKPIIVPIAVFFVLAIAGCGGSDTGSEPANTSADEESTTTVEESTTTEMSTTTTTALPMTYETLSDRDWKLLVKNPNASIGKGVMVSAYIFQFDANTGPTTFLANGFYSASVRNSYGGDIIRIDGSESDLAALLQGDKVTCECAVLGSYSYDTKAGGSNTAIWFLAKSVVPG